MLKTFNNRSPVRIGIALLGCGFLVSLVGGCQSTSLERGARTHMNSTPQAPVQNLAHRNLANNSTTNSTSVSDLISKKRKLVQSQIAGDVSRTHTVKRIGKVGYQEPIVHSAQPNDSPYHGIARSKYMRKNESANAHYVEASNERHKSSAPSISWNSQEVEEVVTPGMAQDDVGSATNSEKRYPIDFPTVLQMAGADNWNVRMARSRLLEAEANHRMACVEWLPSLNFGVTYNHHEGEIQATQGGVQTVSRQSLFVGGGAGISNAPLNGAAGGPPRMVVDFSLADAIFKPLAARQKLAAARAGQSRVINDTLLKASLAYYELVRAQSQLAVSSRNLDEAVQVSELTKAFVESGKGTPADVSRLNVIVNQRGQALIVARTNVEIASARLAKELQLDPCKVDPQTGLFAYESQPLPLELIDVTLDLNTHIAAAHSRRCEITEAYSNAHAADSQYQSEVWRQLLPNLYLGFSGGGFGGGTGGDLPKLDTRSDFDVAMIWQVKNLGLGNRAAKQASRNRVNQRAYEAKRIKDEITEQVISTFHTVKQFHESMNLLRDNIRQASDALIKNLDAIRGLQGMPLEAIVSLTALADARRDYLDSVVSYNQWQLRLMRATGVSFSGQADTGCRNCDSSACTGSESSGSCETAACSSGIVSHSIDGFADSQSRTSSNSKPAVGKSYFRQNRQVSAAAKILRLFPSEQRLQSR